MRIILPSKYPDLCARALRGLWRTTDVPVTIVWDGENCDEVLTKGMKLSEAGAAMHKTWVRDIHWMLGVQPFIYARNVNIGWKDAAEEDYVIIMGDDVLPWTVDWTEEMQGVMERDPKIGILGAGVLGEAKHKVLTLNWFWEKDFLPHNGDGVPFVCVMIRRAVWEKIGFMDERFTAYGYDDDDYNIRCRKAGWFTGYTHRALVRHGVPGAPWAATFTRAYGGPEELMKKQAENQRIFREKWGK